MNIETLKKILNLNERESLYNDILKFFKNLNAIDEISYQEYEISEGIIPVIFIGKKLDANSIKNVKVIICAQHNEYNGLFAVLEFLKRIQDGKLGIEEILLNDQVLIFFPLMNPYGFLNPSRENKSGYYLKNGTNLNRFWRRTFAPEYGKFMDDQMEYPIPDHAKIVKKILKEHWDREDQSIYLLDIHETSLLKRIQVELKEGLKDDSITYKFDHWLKEAIIKNILNIYNLKYFREPLFYKCNPSADHNHINLSIKLLETVHEKLLQYIEENQTKLPFFFAYNDKGKEFCEGLANIVYNKLKNKLWETNFPIVKHFHDHGCFVKLSDASSRLRVYSMELESLKHFFDLFEEIEKSETDPNYFEKKLKLIDVSIELAVETILALIKLF